VNPALWKCEKNEMAATHWSCTSTDVGTSTRTVPPSGRAKLSATVEKY
jgi:hypothetical protein